MARRIFSFFLFLIISCNGKPMDKETKKYLHTFGYLESMDQNEEDLDAALKDFQYFAGQMDEATKQFLSKPRCGMPDYIKMTSNQLNFRGKWENNEITYVIVNRTRNLNRAAIRKALEKGISLWTNGTDLKMIESKTSSADIKIYFSPQDGPGKNLGFAYYPTNGQMFLDVEEDWSLTPSLDKINFNWVTTHELGHALGLNHIEDPDSIMNPYYQNIEVKLSEHDQKQISDLYRKVDSSDLCKDSTVDDLLNYPLALGQILFQNDKYWTFTKTGLTTGPFDANTLFGHFPGKIDAAVSTPAFTYFFKGNYFYRSYRNKRSRASKKSIADGFGRWNLPGHIDASFYHPNKTIYFFKGSVFHAFTFGKGAMQTELQNVRISSYFHGLPDSIEAATMLDGNQALFVKSGLFYVYDFNLNKMEDGSPHNISTELFKC